MRIERDVLGEVQVPKDAIFGSFTVRARENFQLSGLRARPVFIRSLGMIKKAAALANMELGLLDRRIGEAIVEAASQVASGEMDSWFPLDVFQAGAGTPFNMNANEVIANLAILKLGGKPGDYSLVHPNNHVNMSQSSNNVTPTAIRLSCLQLLDPLEGEVKALVAAFEGLARKYQDVIKVGRTHLEDAAPISFGQVFQSYAHSLDSALETLVESRNGLLEIGLGGTVIGTGTNTHPDFRRLVARMLSEVSGYPLRPARDGVTLTWSMAAFTRLSGALRDMAIEMGKIADDLRLLNSGPNAGISEIMLPEVEPGSSIMPGKINPSIAEAVNMVCFQIRGNDHTIALASAGGELEMNVMTPLIGFNLIFSLELLTNCTKMFRERCVEGIQVNQKRCQELIDKSLSLAVALSPFLGYDATAELVKNALKEGKPLRQAALETGLTPEMIDEILDPQKMTGPRTFDPRFIEEVRKKLG